MQIPAVRPEPPPRRMPRIESKCMLTAVVRTPRKTIVRHIASSSVQKESVGVLATGNKVTVDNMGRVVTAVIASTTS